MKPRRVMMKPRRVVMKSRVSELWGWVSILVMILVTSLFFQGAPELFAVVCLVVILKNLS